MPSLIDWQTIQAIDTGGSIVIAISTLQALFLQACSSFYKGRYSWVYGANDVTDEQWDAISALQSQVELDLMGNMVGLILPNVLADISNIPFLDCDGSSYLRVDYPSLYSVIASAYIIDADNFKVPDLRDAFIRGASAINPIGTIGGTDEETLDISKMPAHSHVSPPHSHSDSGAIGSTVIVNAGAPVPSALPITTITGSASVTIGNEGGGLPHNNIPSFESISYVIVAG